MASEDSVGALRRNRHRSLAPPRREQRRQQLLEGLEELLRARPLTELQVSDITAAAGLQRSAFYFYYPTKYAAVADLLLGFAEQLLAAGDSFLQGNTASAENLRSTFGALIDGWSEHRHLFGAMFEARSADPEVRQLWDEWMQRFVDPVATAIAQARADGRAADGPPAALLAQLLLDLNERSLERHLRDPIGTDAELRDTLVHVWLAALQPPPTGHG